MQLDLAEAHQRLISVFETARRLDLRRLEELREVEALDEALRRPVCGLLADALTVAESLLARFEERVVPESTQRFELAVDQAMRGPSDASHLADLAFMARVELKHRLERLAPTPSGREELLETCESALRRLVKSVSALDLALRRITGGESVPYVFELQTSLETRRQYAALWKAVEDLGEPKAQNVVPAVRVAGTRVAMLVGRDVYPHLRFADRRQLRELQRRILDFLKQPSSRVGVVLWQDFAGFARLLRGINHREELRAHDLGALGELRALVEAKQVVGPRHPLAVRLFGFDDELDQAVKGGAAPEAVVALIRRAQVRLGGTHLE